MKLNNFLQDELSISPGSAKIPIKSLIDRNRERYDKLRKNSAKRFRSEVYVIQPGKRTIVHVKVPSETVDSFYYDVLLELEIGPGSKSIDDCDVHIFSNCPSFVFSYAYVFYHLNLDTTSSKNKSGMIIDTFSRKIPRDRLLVSGTENKLGEKVLDNKPVVKNRLGLPFFDKSIYQAIFYVQDEVPFSSIANCRRYRTELQVFHSISDFDTLMAKRKQLVDRKRLAAKRKRETERREAKVNAKSVQHTKSAVRAVAPMKPVPVKNHKQGTSIRRIPKK